MARLIKKDRGNYTNVSNTLIRDKRLSWKARGIFIYLWSQADEWQFYVSEIATHATEGERALRSGIKELENFGYLKRVHSHSENGSFDGMDWVLTDHPAQNRNDAEMNENPPKKAQNASDAKCTGCETHSMQDGTLRNNNNKNYQYKELSTNKKSSSSSKPSSSNDEIKDPFADDSEADDDEEVITGLIKMFSNEAHVSIPNYQYNHIKNSLLAMDQSDAIDLMYTVVNKVSQGEVQNPIGYLITSIASVKGGE